MDQPTLNAAMQEAFARATRSECPKTNRRARLLDAPEYLLELDSSWDAEQKRWTGPVLVGHAGYRIGSHRILVAPRISTRLIDDSPVSES